MIVGSVGRAFALNAKMVIGSIPVVRRSPSAEGKREGVQGTSR